MDTKDNFESLIAQGDWERAKSLLQDVISQDLDEETKGAIYLALGSAYVKSTTALNNQHAAALQEMAAMLEDLDKKKGSIDDAGELAKTRSALK